MATPSIDLISLLTKAIRFGRMDNDAPIEDIIQLVLAKVELTVSAPAPGTVAVATVSAPSKSRSTARVSKETTGEKRTIRAPEDDVRCMARTLDEKIHTATGTKGGRLLVMRDDPANLYGDRCKFKKTGDKDFCKHHEHNQTLGVWNGEYRDRFLQAVEKTESESETQKKTKTSTSEPKKLMKASPATVKAPAVKKSQVQVKAKSESDTEEDEDLQQPLSIQRKTTVIDEEVSKAKAKAEEVSKPKADAKVLSIDDLEEESETVSQPKEKEEEEEEEDDAVETVSCEIDGQTYQRDEDGNIYDDDGNAVGVYNFETQKWTKKYSN